MLDIENTGSGDLALALVGPAPTLVDPDGRSLAAREASGLPICGNSMAGAYMTANSQAGCLSGSILDHRQFRAIRGGGRAAIGLTFRADSPSAASGDSYMLSATFAVLPKPEEGIGDATPRQRQAQVYLISLPDLRPNSQARR